MTGNIPKCSYCEKMFATQAGKLRHEANVHLGGKDHSCHGCVSKDILDQKPVHWAPAI